MSDETTLRSAEKIAGRVLLICMTLAVLGGISVALAMTLPMDPGASNLDTASRGGLNDPVDAPDVSLLLETMAGRRLIRPSQVQAAVKDKGVAARLVKKLKLQGVLRMGDTLVAYIAVKDQGVQTLREGEMILEFLVKSIEPGKVTLSLEGVEVVLSH